jgi:hypothetical protein
MDFNSEQTESSLDFRLLLNMSPIIVIPGDHCDIPPKPGWLMRHRASARTQRSQDRANGVCGDRVANSDAGDEPLFIVVA